MIIDKFLLIATLVSISNCAPNISVGAKSAVENVNTKVSMLRSKISNGVESDPEISSTMINYIGVDDSPLPAFFGGSSDLEFYKPMPFTRQGHCESGQKYNITSVSDLLAHSKDLMCILDAGIAPSVVPLGNQYGSLLDVLTDRRIRDMLALERLWQGKFSAIGFCNHSTSVMTLGFNMVDGKFRFPSYMNITTLPEECYVNSKEHQDEKPALILNYMRDLNSICVQETEVKSPLFSPQENTNVCAILRVVGRQPDGGYILLGRGMGFPSLNPNFNPVGFSTFVFFALITYDDGTLPNFYSGDEIGPIQNSFDYTLVGIEKSNDPTNLVSLFPYINKTDLLSFDLPSGSSSNQTVPQAKLTRPKEIFNLFNI